VPAVTFPADAVQSPFLQRIGELIELPQAKRIFDNRFYGEWLGTDFSADEFAVFAVNYYHRVYATTRRISIAMETIDDWQSRIQLLHNISDELGHGVEENVHALVVLRWMEGLYGRLGGKSSFRELVQTTELLPQTERFIQATEDLCRASPRSASGALLAQEWHGYNQIAILLDGFLRYRALYEPIEFHDSSEYFYVHLGRAEKEHRDQAITIAGRHCQTEADFDDVRAAFFAYLGLLAEFWDAIADAVWQARRSAALQKAG
jgi:pyrroloquinoline quinone (PQQ) biosynthesis protein C